MAKLITYYCIISLALLLTACGSNEQHKEAENSQVNLESSSEEVQLIVYAAASLSDPLKEVQQLFEAEYKNIKLTYNFASTAVLQKHIEQGESVDFFIAETADSMKSLIYTGLIERDKQLTLLRDELVVIGLDKRKEAIASMTDLTNSDVNRVGLGDPEIVPAGSYAKEALTNAEVWDGILGKLVKANDSKQVLQYVETGNVDAGLVYKTIALSSNKAVILFTVDPALYSTIEFPVGMLKDTKHVEESELLLQFIQSDEVLAIFKKYGFTV